MREKAARVFLLSALFVVGLFAFSFAGFNHALATPSNLIGFQGKLTKPDGTNVADNTYSILFNIYSGTGCTDTGGAPCASVWNETQSVSTVDGIFHVNLGAVTTLPGAVDFNLNPLYLSITVGGDPEMSPRILFTASPYAFNSAKLGGIDSTGYVQLAQGLQTDASTSNASISINKTGGTADILQLQRGGTPEVTVSNAGAMTLAQLLTGQAGASITGGQLTLTGNTGSSITTSSGALTITSAAAATWSTTAGGLTITSAAAATWKTSAGDLTIQSGSGTVSLGTSTILNATGALTVTAGAGNALTLTSPTAATWSTTAGGLTITSAAAATWSTTAGALTITSAAAATWKTTAGDLTIQGGSGNVSLGTSTTLTATAGLTVTAGAGNALTLTSPTAAIWSTTAGGLTITSAAAATWKTTAGDLTIQGGSGSISLGTTTTLTAGGALTVTAAAANALTLTSPVAATWKTTAGDLTLQGGSGNVSLGTSTKLTASGALTVAAAAGSALTLTSPVAATWSTTAGALTITSAAATTWSTTAGALTITSAAAATWSTTAGNLTVQAGSGTVSLGASTILSATNALTIAVGTGNSLTLTNPTAPPSVDQVVIANVGQAVTSDNVNGLKIDYHGGAMAVEGGGARVDITPGTTTGGTWNGIRIIADATGATSGVTENGLKITGPSSPGAGTEVGLVIDANWDAGLQMGSKVADPGTPPTDNIYVYAQKIAGRSMLGQKGPSGVSFAYQPALFEQAITYQAPLTAATITSIGSTWTVDTTATTPGASEVFGFTTNLATVNTTNDTAGISENIVQHYRGSVANGSNGFFYVGRMGLPDASYGAGATGSRIWIGLTTQTTATMTGNDNPAGDWAGFQYSTNRGDTGWRFMTKDNVTPNLAAASLALAQNKVYDFYIYAAPQGATVYWRVDNLTDGTTQEGNTAANLPRNNQPMRAGMGIQTLTTTARNIRIVKQYVESDR